ncbi:MAG: hypothetical protein ABI383_08970 [Acidobacteriaceae bacterium]
MQSTRTGRAAAGFSSSAAQYALQIVLQAFLAPIILRYAGRETLGAYAALYQGLNFLALVDFGYSQPLERFLAQAHGKSDAGEGFRNIFGTFRTLLLISNFVFAVLVLLYAYKVGAIFHLSAPIAHQARLGLILLSIWAFIRTPLSAYSSALFAVQELAPLNGVLGVMNVTRLFISLILVRLGAGLLGLMVAALATEILGNLAYRWLFLHKYPEREPSWGFRDRHLLNEILHFGGHTAIMQIASLITFSSGSLFVGFLFGADTVAIYYTTQTPCLLLYNMIFRLSDNAGPALNDLWAAGEFDRVRTGYRKLMTYSAVCAATLIAGLLLFNGVLVSFWVGTRQYAGFAATAALALVVVVFVLDHVNGLFAVVIGKMPLMTKTTIIQSLLMVPLTLVLSHLFGIAGVILASGLALLPRAVVLTTGLARALNLSLRGWSRIALQIARYLSAPVLGSTIFLLLTRSFPLTWQLFAGVGLFTTLAILSLYRSSLMRAEFDYVTGALRTRLLRLRATPV